MLAIGLILFLAGSLAGCGTTPPKDEPLHAAARAGQVSEVERLLQAGEEADLRRNDGTTPLHIAAGEGKLEVVKVLLAHRANVNARDKYERTALTFGAKDGTPEVAAVLLANGADVNAANPAGLTALHDAAFFGKAEYADVLLNHGAAVNAQSKQNARTPLLNAAEAGHIECVKVLLEHGADATARIDIPGKSPIVYGFDGASSLHFASWTGRTDIAEALLARGADLNLPDKHGLTPLHYAVAGNRADMLPFLAEHGADVNAQQEVPEESLGQRISNSLNKLPSASSWRTGDTPLHKAAALDRAEAVAVLADLKANLDAENDNHFTPLDIAVGYGNIQTAYVLMDAGASPSGHLGRSDQSLLDAMVQERMAYGAMQEKRYSDAAAFFDKTAEAYNVAYDNYGGDETRRAIGQAFATVLVGALMAVGGRAGGGGNHHSSNQAAALHNAAAHGKGIAGYHANLARLRTRVSVHVELAPAPATGAAEAAPPVVEGIVVATPLESPGPNADMTAKRELAKVLAQRSKDIGECARGADSIDPAECVKAKGLEL